MHVPVDWHTCCRRCRCRTQPSTHLRRHNLSPLSSAPASTNTSHRRASVSLRAEYRRCSAPHRTHISRSVHDACQSARHCNVPLPTLASTVAAEISYKKIVFYPIHTPYLQINTTTQPSPCQLQWHTFMDTGTSFLTVPTCPNLKLTPTNLNHNCSSLQLELLTMPSSILHKESTLDVTICQCIDGTKASKTTEFGCKYFR